MTLTDEQLAELRKVAEAATPGPWTLDDARCVSAPDGTIIYDASVARRGEWEDDACFVITFDPPTVLALLAELSQLRAQAADAVGAAEREVGRYVYRRIAALMDARAGTPEAAELVYLSTLVESVEEYGEEACADHALSPPLRENQMTDDQIKHMVNRFLAWRLPEDFSPDCGIQFDADAAKKLNPRNGRYEPVGTNLFSAAQAEAMVRYMLEGLPELRAQAACDETAWLIEETWSGHVHYVHRDFRCDKIAAEWRQNDWRKWIGLPNLFREHFITKNVEDAMRFPTKEAAEIWLGLQPRWMNSGDQYQVREHMWPAPLRAQAAWRPIESAPRDGTDILGSWRTGAVGEGHPVVDVCWWAGGWMPYDRKLTHWMPLPVPPSQEEG